MYNGPAFALALESVNEKFNTTFRLSLTYMLHAHYKTSQNLEENAVNMMSRWYYKQRRDSSVLSVIVNIDMLKRVNQ